MFVVLYNLSVTFPNKFHVVIGFNLVVICGYYDILYSIILDNKMLIFKCFFTSRIPKILLNKFEFIADFIFVSVGIIIA